MTPEHREELEEALACLYEAESRVPRLRRTQAFDNVRNARKRLERVLHPQEEVEP